MGRIDKEKGVEELIDACAILNLKTKITFSLDIIGGGVESYLNFLKHKIENLNIDGVVKFRGRVNDSDSLKYFYLNSDIFVFPSHHEGFPRVLYEAMTFSLPIVTTKLETYKGIMNNAENCLFVDIENPEQISAAILNLFNSMEIRRKLGISGYNYMKDYYQHIVSNSHALQVLNSFNFKNSNL